MRHQFLYPGDHQLEPILHIHTLHVIIGDQVITKRPILPTVIKLFLVLFFSTADPWHLALPVEAGFQLEETSLEAKQPITARSCCKTQLILFQTRFCKNKNMNIYRLHLAVMGMGDGEEGLTESGIDSNK